MKRQNSIRVKLYSALAAITAVAVGGSVYSVFMARSLRERVIQEMVKGAKRLDESRQISIDVAGMRSAMRGVSLFAIQNHPEQVRKARDSFAASAADVRTVLEEAERTDLLPDERAAVNEIRSDVERWLASFTTFADVSVSGHADQAAESALKTVTPILDALQRRTAALGRAGQARQDTAAQTALAQMRRNETLNWVLMFVLLAAAGAGMIIVTGLIITLKGVAAAIQNGSQEVASAAAQVSGASQALAHGSSQQAASLEETSAATAEINSMAQRNTENSETSAKIVMESAARFEEANRLLEQMVVASGEIDASSNKISKIIKVIDEIAFQTNILALNAAVEAARAGEAGMGFAVVADEVRNLAQRSSQAAKDTAALIEESIEKSSGGSARVDQVVAALRAITEQAGRVKTLVDEVNLGSKEQARGIQQIAGSISKMEQVTQKTAAETEETAAASEQLRAQSDSMRQVAERLAVLIGGSR